MKLWIVGKVLEKAPPGRLDCWELQAIFETEDEAKKAAQPSEFISRVTVGVRFPEEAIDAEILYFPNEETWEASALYKMRGLAS